MIEYDEDTALEPEPYDGHFTDVAVATSTPPQWVVKDLLPVGLTFIGGPPKVSNKSTQLLALGALVAGFKNTLFPPHMRQVQRTGRVGMLSAEADAGVVRHMLERDMNTPDLCANGSFLIADDPWAFRLDRPEGMTELHTWLHALQPRLLGIDPFKNFHSADEKDSGLIYDILAPLRKWATENEAAVVVVHHTKKIDSNEKRDYNEMDLRGTTAMFGIADGVLISSPVDPSKKIVRLKATFKRGAPWERTLRLACYEFKNRPPSEVMSALAEKVLAAYQAGCESMDEVATQVRTAKSNVVEAVDSLVRNGLLVREGKKISVAEGE